MESVIQYFQSLDLNWGLFIKAVGAMVVCSLILALIGRFVFGKRSTLCRAVSSAIGILFIYVITVVLANASEQFQGFLAPLPFVTFAGEKMYLLSFYSDYTVVCSHILSMIILAFLMNLADSLLPVGKKFFGWIIFRCLSLIIALVLLVIVVGLLTRFLPQGLITYAPVILLGILVLMLLTGALKFLVGLVLTTVNPLIAALYTFFFANIVGKQITKAVLTTAIMAGLVFLLQKLGIVAISIASAVLVAYIPLLIVLLVLWYVIGKLL